MRPPVQGIRAQNDLTAFEIRCRASGDLAFSEQPCSLQRFSGQPPSPTATFIWQKPPARVLAWHLGHP
jgi:hypothetical protein